MTSPSVLMGSCYREHPSHSMWSEHHTDSKFPRLGLCAELAHLGYTIYGLGPDFLETKLPAIGLGCPSETADCRNLREANRGRRSHRVATARFRVPNRVR